MITRERLKEKLTYNKYTGKFTWNTSENQVSIGVEAGTNLKGYVHISVDGNKYLAHRLAWFYEFGELPASEIDHINRDKSDNRIENLREADRSLNVRNTPARSKSGYKGIYWYKKYNKWRVAIKDKHVGYFSCFKEALLARKKAEVLIYGDYNG